MKVQRLFILIISICCLFLLSCTEHYPDENDWKFFNAGHCTSPIDDNGSSGAGVDLSSYAPDPIIEIEFEIKLIHDAPATLKIELWYDTDTIPIWVNNDFPGGRQKFRPDTLIGRPINKSYMVNVTDEAVDGIEGRWELIIIKINY